MATILALLSGLSFLTIDAKTGRKEGRERGRKGGKKREGERRENLFITFIHLNFFFKVSEWGVRGVNQ